MTISTIRRSIAALVMAVVAGACGLPLEGGADADGKGQLVLAFSKASTATDEPAARTAVTFAGNVSLGQIQSITVTVTAIEALYQEFESDEADWVTRTLATPITLNLLALPVTTTDAVKATVEALDAGTYFNLRLRVSNATIRFKEDISIGGGPVAKTYRTGVDYPIRIVGEPGERLLLPTARFEIANDNTTAIDVIFDEGTSVRSVVATPNFVLMAPVLIATNERDSD